MQRPHVVPSLSSHLGFDWSQVSSTITEAANAWNAYNNPPRPVPTVPQPMLGGSTATLLLVGGALILGYALISKRRG